MKVAILASMMVIAILLVPPNSAGIVNKAIVKSTCAAIKLGLLFVPGKALDKCITGLVEAVFTTPFSLTSLLGAIFDVIEAALSMGGKPSKLASQVLDLISDICTLILDAVSGKYDKLGQDITNVICAAEALAGLSKCYTEPLTTAINQLIKDAKNRAPATKIVADAFEIAKAAIQIGVDLTKGTKDCVPLQVTNAVLTLLTCVCDVIIDCLNFDLIDISTSIIKLVNATVNLAKLC